jgi:two-component system NtrC family sensor kinase
MRLSLITKLTLLTSLILVAFMALFAYVKLDTLRQLLVEEAASDADKLSETIIKTTHYQMLVNDLPRVYEMIREVGTQSGITHIRLINKSGRIIFSTDENEIGTFLDKNAQACNMCHAGQTPLLHATTMNRSRIFFDRSGKQVLGLAKAIYNEEKCYTAKCHFHTGSFRVLGVLDVIVSLDKMQALLKSYRDKMINMTFFLLLLVWICLTLCMQKMVNIPVRQLLQHAKRVGSGELGAAVAITSRDEMGELAEALNEMTLKLKSSHNELEEWARTLEEKVRERTQELQRMQRQLIHSEKLASLGELVAGIAHEINNPLTGILVFSSLIKNDDKLDPTLKNDLETVIRETERCATIVRGLLEFSRESVPQKAWTSLNQVMDASLALVENQAQFQNITIHRNYSPAIPEFSADPNQLEQVFINMLLNASHAMPNGGTLRITTEMASDGKCLQVKIADTGCGIPEENMAKIFDPFFTTRQNGGTGLGLSVSYGIVNNHGGIIEVESAIGVGTTFTIRLPADTETGHCLPQADEALLEWEGI